MRVLYLAHGIPPTALGGAEIYAHAIARELAVRHGQESWFLAREADKAREEYGLRRDDRDGLKVVLFNNTFARCTTFEDTYRNPAAAEVILRFVDEIRPDLVHVHHLSGLSFDALLGIADRGIPILYALHDFFLICNRGQLFDLDLERCDGPYPDGCGKCVDAFALAGGSALKATGWAKSVVAKVPGLGRVKGRLKRAAEKVVAGRIDEGAALRATVIRREYMLGVAERVTRFQTPSATMRNAHLRFGVAPDKLVPHDTGIVQTHLRGIAPSESDVLRVGFVGSLIASKAPHLLLEAFEAIPRDVATLHVYGNIGPYHGDDSYRRVLEPLLARDYVNHPGPVQHDDIAKVLGELDVLVVTSIWLENSPLVIREAFAAGLTVIVSDLGGMAEMVRHEVDGLLFRTGDVDELRAAILRLAGDRELLRRLRAAVPEVRTIEDDAAETRALYAELVG